MPYFLRGLGAVCDGGTWTSAFTTDSNAPAPWSHVFPQRLSSFVCSFCLPWSSTIAVPGSKTLNASYGKRTRLHEETQTIIFFCDHERRKERTTSTLFSKATDMYDSFKLFGVLCLSSGWTFINNGSASAMLPRRCTRA